VSAGGVVLAALTACVALAAPGGPDRTFGGDGRALMPRESAFTDAVVDRRGRVTAVGHITSSGLREFLVARYTPRGRLDRTFGGGDGFVQTDVFGHNEATGVALDRRGRIVVAGWGTDFTTGHVAVARYRSSGALDTSFATEGPDGIFTLDVNPTGEGDLANDVAIDRQGRIVLAGLYTTGAGEADFLVMRLLGGGVPDASFGNAGVETTDLPGNPSDDQANAVAIDSKGRIIAAGYNDPDLGDAAMAAVRYLPGSGDEDSAFGDGSVALVPHGPLESEAADEVAIAPGDRVVLGGRTNDVDAAFQAARLRADGEVDSAFGDGGTREIVVGEDDVAQALVQDADGRLIVTGTTALEVGGLFRFAAARLTPNGGIDRSFGRQGRMTLGFPQGESRATGAAIDPRSGRLLLAGDVTDDPMDRGALARVETQPRCFGKAPTIAGTKGRDRLRGTGKADVIYGGGGRDRLNGKGGKDLLCGGPGRDRLNGGPGRDREKQ
jgi:uncharacterized delta-60 repeat protein